jgi:hypothetical protein
LDVGKAFGTRIASSLRRGTGPGSLILIASTPLYTHLEAPIAWSAIVQPNIVSGEIEISVIGAPASPVNWWAYADVIEV